MAARAARRRVSPTSLWRRARRAAVGARRGARPQLGHGGPGGRPRRRIRPRTDAARALDGPRRGPERDRPRRGARPRRLRGAHRPRVARRSSRPTAPASSCCIRPRWQVRGLHVRHPTANASPTPGSPSASARTSPVSTSPDSRGRTRASTWRCASPATPSRWRTSATGRMPRTRRTAARSPLPFPYTLAAGERVVQTIDIAVTGTPDGRRPGSRGPHPARGGPAASAMASRPRPRPTLPRQSGGPADGGAWPATPARRASTSRPATGAQPSTAPPAGSSRSIRAPQSPGESDRAEASPPTPARGASAPPGRSGAAPARCALRARRVPPREHRRSRARAPRPPDRARHRLPAHRPGAPCLRSRRDRPAAPRAHRGGTRHRRASAECARISPSSNREHHRPPRGLAGIVFSSTPLFHSLSTAQLVESLPMQRIVATQGVRIAAGIPAHRPDLAASALQRRGDDSSADARARRPPRRLRLGSCSTRSTPGSRHRELAAWTIASAAALAVPGVATLAYFEEWGPRGVRTADGAALPVLAAVSALAAMAGAPGSRGDSPDGLVAGARSPPRRRRHRSGRQPRRSRARQVGVTLPIDGTTRTADVPPGRSSRLTLAHRPLPASTFNPFHLIQEEGRSMR